MAKLYVPSQKPRAACSDGMTDSILEQARLAHRGGDLKRALGLSERGLEASAGELSSAERYELLVLKSHRLSALVSWEEALVPLESASQVGDLSVDAEARLAMLPHGFFGPLR